MLLPHSLNEGGRPTQIAPSLHLVEELRCARGGEIVDSASSRSSTSAGDDMYLGHKLNTRPQRTSLGRASTPSSS